MWGPQILLWPRGQSVFCWSNTPWDGILVWISFICTQSVWLCTVGGNILQRWLCYILQPEDINNSFPAVPKSPLFVPHCTHSFPFKWDSDLIDFIVFFSINKWPSVISYPMKLFGFKFRTCQKIWWWFIPSISSINYSFHLIFDPSSWEYNWGSQFNGRVNWSSKSVSVTRGEQGFHSSVDISAYYRKIFLQPS